MIRKFLTLCLLVLIISSCKNESAEIAPSIKVDPISHATMILSHKNLNIYIDPVGGEEVFRGKPAADIIFITDIHGDHLNLETLKAIHDSLVPIVVPQAVADRISSDFKGAVHVMNNGERGSFTIKDETVSVEAIPMYNLREEALKFHTKGRGNGYVINLDGQRIYVSGDTEDIPEMRALKDIDMAFVCMNLPWTMPVENAADAVLDFKPGIVYPYHYRGTNGLSNIQKFKKTINETKPEIDVRLLNWYP